MAGILSTLGRGNQKKDPMRESAALTTVYLLEQNQKFERFMQQKVDDLESRVAAQQARLSTREETEERELWAALEAGDEIDDVATEPDLVDDGSPPPEPEFGAEDSWSDWNEPPPTPADDEASLEHVTAAEPEAVPDYLALMGGAATEPVSHAAIANEEEGDGPVGDAAWGPYLETEGSTVPVAPLASSPDDEVHMPVPEDASIIGDESATSPTHASDASPVTGEVEQDSWPDQYEAFQVAWPDGDEVDDLWPDVDVADGVELLAGQTAIDEKPLPASLELSSEHLTRSGEPTGSQYGESKVTDPKMSVEAEPVMTEPANQEAMAEPEPATNEIDQVESETTAEPGSAGRKTDDDPAGLETETVNLSETSIAAGALDQADKDEAEPWESALPAGQKDEWS